jgi:hypothetical protein
MAFDAGDVSAAETLADEIGLEGAAPWKLDSTIADLEISVQLTQQAETKAELAGVLDRLKALL